MEVVIAYINISINRKIANFISCYVHHTNKLRDTLLTKLTTEGWAVSSSSLHI